MKNSRKYIVLNYLWTGNHNLIFIKKFKHKKIKNLDSKVQIFKLFMNG